MNKKTVFLTLIAALLIAACGGGATPAASTPAASNSTAASTSSGAPVEITYMMWGEPEELAVWQKIVDEFQATHPNIKVKVDVSDWDGYWAKLKTLYASNIPPDVFAMDGPLYPDWQSRGVLLNLQPYIDATPGLLDGLYPNTLATYKRSDGYYGLPRDLQPIVLFYNKDMFDKAGVAYPTGNWTLDDLRATAKKLTLDTDGDGKIDQWGFSSDLWDMELFWSEVLWDYGGDVIDVSQGKTLLGDSQARKGWQYISDLVNVDKSVPDPDTVKQFGNDVFAADHAAMTTIGHWAVPGYSVLNFKWDVAPFPAGPAGHATSVNSAGFVVAKDSKHPAEAWEFIKFAVGTQGQTRLTELGFAVPILKSIAESPTFLKQSSININQQAFIDSLAFARPKPSFRGYDQWATVVGDNLIPAWTGEKPINTALDEIVPQADTVLSENK